MADHRKQVINNRRALNERYDLCQILRDMVNIGEETDWNLRTSVQSIYRSIGSYINSLKHDNLENYKTIEKLVLDSYSSLSDTVKSLDVLNVYEIVRPNESFGFNRAGLGNVKLLFHGSRVNNFVGILSRGLLLPKYVVNEENNDLVRTDEGYWQSFFIYFNRTIYIRNNIEII